MKINTIKINRIIKLQKTNRKLKRLFYNRHFNLCERILKVEMKRQTHQIKNLYNIQNHNFLTKHKTIIRHVFL